MQSDKRFDYNRAFNSVDDWNYVFIDKKNLKSFFRQHGYLASSDEVMAIIRRMDMDADARLSKQEFIEGIKPDEPYSKSMKRSESKKKRKRVSFRHSRKISTQYPQDDLIEMEEG